MTSLRARLAVLIVGFGLGTAALLAAVMYASASSYYDDWMYDRSCRFAERIIEHHPELWRDYEDRHEGYGERLSQYTLYSPNTGLYLLDVEGHVLAGAGERRPNWDHLRVDLAPVIAGMRASPDMPVYTDDPDAPARKAMVAARPVFSDGLHRGWLLVVPRQIHFSAQMPEMLRSYALRTAATIGLMTIALGALLTLAMMTLFTRPLTALTRATEQVRNAGFCNTHADELFPQADRDDEIGRLSRTFREAFERLEQEAARVQTTDARRREMIASVSHDLRTPLTALTGQLETIRLKNDTLSEAERARLLGQALLNAGHLRRLTDALAELARLDSPDFEAQREPIALGELADDVVQRFADTAQQAGIELELNYPDGLPLARVDAALVERALANLLDNALRVSAGGKVRVSVSRHGPDSIRLEVADSGPGVRDADRARVFERFFQSSDARELRGSSGLGLAIVKRVAELHGGVAGLLKPRASGGARFFLDLPRAV